MGQKGSVVSKREKETGSNSRVSSGVHKSESHPPTIMVDASAVAAVEEQIHTLREELASTKQQLKEQIDRVLQMKRENHRLKKSMSLGTSEVTKRGVDSSPSRRSTSRLSVTPMIKKCGVSGESCDLPSPSPSGCHFQMWEDQITKVDKQFSERILIQDALLGNSLLKNFLEKKQLQLIVDTMYSRIFPPESLLCEEGTMGSHLFVIQSGDCDVIVGAVEGDPVKTLSPGQAMGELAILYNCARTATVRARTEVKVWVLDRRVFQTIMMKTGTERRSQYKTFLKSVPLFHNLSNEIIGKIVDSISIERYEAGDYVCRQGSLGDTFYIISEGSVRIFQEVTDHEKGPQVTQEKTLRTLTKGDFFGEKALLAGEGPYRTANVISQGCECLSLDKNSFFSLIGDLSQLRETPYEMDFRADNERKISSEIPQEDESYPNVKLYDLDTIALIGVGGFGKVNLVRHTPTSKVFALKACSKAFIRLSQQEHHINNERIVQKIASRHQFVTKLYRTFRDSSFIYFLMEPLLGGELWTLLKNRGAFDEVTARFYVGCVVEAIQFLHSQRIVYRDLKPENCLLDTKGYLKLSDFGFSKILKPGEKTWTFCGTPEYVAPEVILNRGHDNAVDFWSLGVFLYELLNGLPPFQSSDPLKTYSIILRGFDAIGFDDNIFSKNAINLIRSLCKENPLERLGVQKNCFKDLKQEAAMRFDYDQQLYEESIAKNELIKDWLSDF